MTSASQGEAPTRGTLPLDAFRQMVTIRHLEQRCLELSLEGLIAGSVHLCLGQEAIPVGAMSVLGERCQKADGVNGGRGGSPYFFAPRWGMLGENSIVGAGVPIGAGVAMAAQRRADGGVVLTSIGDGAMN